MKSHCCFVEGAARGVCFAWLLCGIPTGKVCLATRFWHSTFDFTCHLSSPFIVAKPLFRRLVGQWTLNTGVWAPSAQVVAAQG